MPSPGPSRLSNDYSFPVALRCGESRPNLRLTLRIIDHNPRYVCAKLGVTRGAEFASVLGTSAPT